VHITIKNKHVVPHLKSPPLCCHHSFCFAWLKQSFHLYLMDIAPNPESSWWIMNKLWDNYHKTKSKSLKLAPYSMPFPIPVVYGSSWSTLVLQSSHTYISINVVQPKAWPAKLEKNGKKKYKRIRWEKESERYTQFNQWVVWRIPI